MTEASSLPLSGFRVVDAATLFAAPLVGTLFGDYGADVIKVEHPDGDSSRSIGWKKDGEPLGWPLYGRNKRSITLKISDPAGAEALKRLLATADVFIENFRPGTLERWGLGWDVLHEINPRLIMLRTTGFGQTGPYAPRPGYGTLAEAMSGFAHMNGHPDGPPTLPPLGLGDGVAGLAGAFATLVALLTRERGQPGQVIDLAIYEPLFWILSAASQSVTVYDQLGIVQSRMGNGNSVSAPRDMYKAADGKWLAISAIHPSIADRAMRLVGRADLADQPWFPSNAGRLEHQAEINAALIEWIGQRSSDEVLQAFEKVGAAVAVVMSIDDIVEHPQFTARETITTVDHPTLGPIRMPNIITPLSATPGKVRWCGPALGQHNREILKDELGYTDEELRELEERNIITGF